MSLLATRRPSRDHICSHQSQDSRHRRKTPTAKTLTQATSISWRKPLAYGLSQADNSNSCLPDTLRSDVMTKPASSSYITPLELSPGEGENHASPAAPVQVEGEDVLVHQLLLHQVVKDGKHIVDRDTRVCHAQDAIKLGCDECDSRLLGGFPKDLFLHLETAWLLGLTRHLHARIHVSADIPSQDNQKKQRGQIEGLNIVTQLESRTWSQKNKTKQKTIAL